MLCFFVPSRNRGTEGCLVSNCKYILTDWYRFLLTHWMVCNGVYAEILPDLVVTVTRRAKPTNLLTNKSQTDKFSHFTLHCMHCLISLSRLTQNKEDKATSTCSNTSTTAINPNHSFAMKHAFLTPGVCADYLPTRDYCMLHIMLRYFLPSYSERNQPFSNFRHQQ